MLIKQADFLKSAVYEKDYPEEKEFTEFAFVGRSNVGKSSLINRLSGRKSTVTGDRPGVTKGKQWVRLKGNMELLDTPGVLWPKFENDIGLKLAYTGTIKEEVLPKVDVMYELVKTLLEVEAHKIKLIERYKLDSEKVEEILNQEQAMNINIYEVIQEIGKKRGCIMQGRSN